MSRLPSLSRRELELNSPRMGISTATTSVAAGAPGTAVTMDTLKVANKKIMTLTPVVADSQLYSIKIRSGNENYTASFTSDATATAAEISAGLNSAINAAMPASSIAATDTNPSVTLTSEVDGLSFDVVVLSGSIAPAVTNALAVVDSHVVKIWLHNAGSNPMIVRQAGNAVMIVAAGQVEYEFIDPFGGDLAVVGAALESFTIIATAPVENLRP